MNGVKIKQGIEGGILMSTTVATLDKTTSSEFYRRFRAGELGDEMDFVEWSVFYEMYQAILQRLEALGANR